VTDLSGDGSVMRFNRGPFRETAVRDRQRGITFIGMLCIFVLVGAIAYAGILLVPVYLNYYKIVRSLQSVSSEFKNDNPDPGRIRVALDKRWNIEWWP